MSLGVQVNSFEDELQILEIRIDELSRAVDDADVFYKVFLENVVELLGVGGAVWQINEFGEISCLNHMNLVIAGLDEQGNQFDLSQKALARVVESTSPVVLPGLDGSNMYDGGLGKDAINRTAHTLLYVPIFDENQLKHIFLLIAPADIDPRAIQGFLEFLNRLCRRVGVLLQRLRLRDTGQHLARAERLRDYYSALHCSLDPKRSCFALANYAQEMLGVYRCMAGSFNSAGKFRMQSVSGLETVAVKSSFIKSISSVARQVCRNKKSLLVDNPNAVLGSDHEAEGDDLIAEARLYMLQAKSMAMGVLCIIYTIMGGIEAVIWNDCLQTVVLFGTAIWILIIVFTSIEGGVSTVITMGMADNKFQFVDWSWDYTVAALWIVIIGGSLTGVQGMISDQATIQRYMTTPDLKQAQKSLWLQIWILIPMNILFFMLGTAFYVYYKTNPGQLNPVIDTDAILPWFVVQKMPAGICGLMIAGIFAASMSSLDSSIHATMTAIMNDFYHRFKPGISDKSYFRLARWTTLIIGVIGTGLGLLLSVYNIPSLWDFFMKILGLLGGGVTGIFVLGVFSKRANGPGAFVGAIISAVLVFAAQTYTHMHFFLYGAIGLVSAIVVGYLASLIIPTDKKDLTGLTIYTVEKG
jgi:SSS family transporter